MGEDALQAGPQNRVRFSRATVGPIDPDVSIAAMLAAWVVTSSGGTLVRLPSGVPAYATLAAQLHKSYGALHVSSLDERAELEAPARVIAIGQAATDDAIARWPAAQLLSIYAFEPPKSADLWVSPHPQTECTAKILRSRVGEGSWFVLADKHDTGAQQLAQALDGALLEGSPRRIRRRLQKMDPQHTKRLFVRASPLYAHPHWLRYLWMSSRFQNVYVAGDSWGFTNVDLPAAVTVDVAATAQYVAAWLHHPPRGKKRLRTWEAPCSEP